MISNIHFDSSSFSQLGDTCLACICHYRSLENTYQIWTCQMKADTWRNVLLMFVQFHSQQGWNYKSYIDFVNIGTKTDNKCHFSPPSTSHHFLLQLGTEWSCHRECLKQVEANIHPQWLCTGQTWVQIGTNWHYPHMTPWR